MPWDEAQVSSSEMLRTVMTSPREGEQLAAWEREEGLAGGAPSERVDGAVAGSPAERRDRTPRGRWPTGRAWSAR